MSGSLLTLWGSLLKKNYRIVNGWGIGSAVINGALDAIYSSPGKHFEDQLVMRPFPQVASKNQNLATLWEEYRRRMIGFAGVCIFLFGNKRNNAGEIVTANGMIREFEIALDLGRIPIPVGATGYASQEIWNQIAPRAKEIYQGVDWVIPLVEEICDAGIDRKLIVDKLLAILNASTASAQYGCPRRKHSGFAKRLGRSEAQR